MANNTMHHYDGGIPSPCTNTMIVLDRCGMLDTSWYSSVHRMLLVYYSSDGIECNAIGTACF